MRNKNNSMNKFGFLGFITVLIYCLCAMLGVVWVTIGATALMGKFSEPVIYPETLFFEYPDLSFNGYNIIQEQGLTPEEIEAKEKELGHPIQIGEDGFTEDKGQMRGDCLRVSGYTREKKAEIIANAPEEEREYLEKNIIVDRKFVVKCNSEDITMLDITLTVSDPSIATVPQKVKIGEEVVITPVLVNGVNKGGFVEINATASNGVYTSQSLKVFVDVPVLNLTSSLPDTFNCSTKNIENGLIVSDEAIDGSKNNELVYTMYEGDTTTISTLVYPHNCLNASTQSASVFAPYQKNNKVVEYYIEYDQTIYDSDFSVDAVTGEVVANKVGLYKVCAKVLKTYDDEIFIADYVFPFEFEKVIPESELVGRYVYTYIYIQVLPIVLSEIRTNDNPININLYESIVLTAQDLGVQLISSRGDNTYFQSEMNDLMLISSTPECLTIEKTIGKAEWRLTAVAEPAGITLELYHPEYLDVSKVIENISINIIEVARVELNGTSRDSYSDYNNLVNLTIKKETEEDETTHVKVETIVTEAVWDYSNAVTIISNDTQNNPQTTFHTYRIFALGVYQNGVYKEGVFENEQGNPIISLGAYYEGLGCEVVNDTQVAGEYSYAYALSRGKIVLCAYVIKTDMNGNPIDANGNVIIDASQSYVKVGQSQTVELIVTEELSELSASVMVEGEEQEQATETPIENESVIVVSIGSTLDINLFGNSVGALIDAVDNEILQITRKDENIVVEAKILDYSRLSLKFECSQNNITKINTNVSIKMRAGLEQVYETLKTINFYVVAVPVGEIIINSNGTPSSPNYYECVGSLDFTVNDGGEVTNLESKWGQIKNNRLEEFVLDAPTLVAGEITYDIAKPIVPKKLTVSNRAFNYYSSDNSILEFDRGDYTKLIVKQIDKEVQVTCKSTANPEITDTITLKFKLPTCKWKWSNLENNIVTRTQLQTGVALERSDISIEIVPDKTIHDYGDEEGTFTISSLTKVNGASLVKYKIADASTEDFIELQNGTIYAGTSSQYNGKYMKFKTGEEKSAGVIKIVAYIETTTGFIMLNEYQFEIADE